jgi:hypothetical protein
MESPGTRRRAASRAATVGVAIGVALLSFLFRFNTLGGSFGGFANDEFGVLTGVDMVLAGQQPLRDFAEPQLRGAWPSLTYEVPALAQRIWGRTLLVYACVTLGVLAACAAGVFLLAHRLSQSWVLAILAAGLVVVSMPRPYNYPKLLVLTVAAVLVEWAARNVTSTRIAMLALWTIVAGLFRHDFGVYVAGGAVLALVTCPWRPWTVPARRVALFVAFTGLLSVPSVLWVARYQGIVPYVRDMLLSSSTEVGTRKLSEWPVLTLDNLAGSDSAIAVVYYACWIIPLCGAVLLAARSAGPGAPASQPSRAVGVALVGMAIAANLSFLRANLPARFGDAIVPVVLVGAWFSGATRAIPSPSGRRVARGAVAALFALMCAAFFPMHPIPRLLDESGLTHSWTDVQERFEGVTSQLRSLPPAEWHSESQGRPGLSRYLAECTDPGDQILLAAPVSEIPYYGGRRFAGGQASFEGGFLKTEDNQRTALARLRQQSVPVVITGSDVSEFADDYTLVADDVRSRYREVGSVSLDESTVVRVFVEAARLPRRTDQGLGFPCFR